MSETVTLEIHREPPEDREGFVLAKSKDAKYPTLWNRNVPRVNWMSFEWWSEIPAPVKPKRFVVEEYRHCGMIRYRVKHTMNMGSPAEAIHSEEAAQRVADIYEETTP